VEDDLAECRSCATLRELYDGSLTDLYPISYTTPDGALCAAVRDLKDTFGARSDNRLAREIGAILSAYPEAHLQVGRLGPPKFDVVAAMSLGHGVHEDPLLALLRHVIADG
jgi:hypothetical protein